MNRRDIHGILLLDKPKGITSNAALQKAKRLFNASKAGHGGSLDPIASGLLPICFGEATKFSRFLLEADKYYQATVRLGIRTDSGDSQGKVLARGSLVVDSVELLEKILESFKGPIFQIPPMYSALKYQGRPLYQLARQNIEVERQARLVNIYSLQVLDWHQQFLSLAIHASKGTYIRTLVDDIGIALGCGAHVVELRRLKTGNFREEQMISFAELEQMIAAEGLTKADQVLLSVDSSITSLPTVRVSKVAADYLCQGQTVTVTETPTIGWVKLLQDQRFLGIGEMLEDGRVAPRRLVKREVSL